MSHSFTWCTSMHATLSCCLLHHFRVISGELNPRVKTRATNIAPHLFGQPLPFSAEGVRVLPPSCSRLFPRATNLRKVLRNPSAAKLLALLHHCHFGVCWRSRVSTPCTTFWRVVRNLPAEPFWRDAAASAPALFLWGPWAVLCHCGSCTDSCSATPTVSLLLSQLCDSTRTHPPRLLGWDMGAEGGMQSLYSSTPGQHTWSEQRHACWHDRVPARCVLW
jgi:hypothetical protein